jgi:hypothetical protein
MHDDNAAFAGRSDSDSRTPRGWGLEKLSGPNTPCRRWSGARTTWAEGGFHDPLPIYSTSSSTALPFAMIGNRRNIEAGESAMGISRGTCQPSAESRPPANHAFRFEIRSHKRGEGHAATLRDIAGRSLALT